MGKNPNQPSLFSELEQKAEKSSLTNTTSRCEPFENIHILAEQTEDYLRLYPGNWLYNAGVVGLLQVLSHYNPEDPFGDSEANHQQAFEFEKDGSVKIKKEIFKEILSSILLDGIPFWHYWYVLESYPYFSVEEKDTKKKRKSLEITYKNETFNYDDEVEGMIEYLKQDNCKKILSFIKKFRTVSGNLFSNTYRNYYNPKFVSDLDKFIEHINFSSENTQGRAVFLKRTSQDASACSFCMSKQYELEPIKTEFMKLIMPSYNEFPNSHWNCSLEGIDKICSVCQFIIIHHHIAFTKLIDGSEIFINTSSFRLMYELNKLVKELYSKKEISKRIQRIFGTTLIEYSVRFQVYLGKWTLMNIEAVIKTSDNEIDFYSLPYHISTILQDRRAISLIHYIDKNRSKKKSYEFKSALEYVLKDEYEGILIDAYHEIKDFLNGETKHLKAGEKLKLYAIIKEKKHV